LREPMDLITNRFLTLFGCNIVDWENNHRAVGQWVIGSSRRKLKACSAKELQTIAAPNRAAIVF
jgi:hypothetical protein